MKTVLIVGAGGSVAEASFFRPSRTREYPPLDGSFFDRASVLEEKYKNVKRAKAALRNAVERDGSFSDPWESDVPVTMEQFFADVYYDVANERSAAAFQVYLRLQDLYSVVIGRTTNWIADQTRSGYLTKVLRSEIARATGEVLTVITFNQDLLIENALNRIKRTASWCLHSLYGGVDLKPLYWDASEATRLGGFLPHHAPHQCGHSPEVELLKLHGSFNWGTRRSTKQPSIDNLFPKKKKEVFVQNAVRVQMGTQEMSHGPGSGRRTWYLWPLIVPPIYEKERIVGIDLIRDLWQTAAQRLRSAERVVVLGYSAPESDVLARQLLRRSYARNGTLSEIIVINPDMSVAAKLKASLACSSLSVYDDVRTYLDAMVDGVPAGVH